MRVLRRGLRRRGRRGVELGRGGGAVVGCHRCGEDGGGHVVDCCEVRPKHVCNISAAGAQPASGVRHGREVRLLGAAHQLVADTVEPPAVACFDGPLGISQVVLEEGVVVLLCTSLDSNMGLLHAPA